MPHPRAKVQTQMPLPWDILDKQMPPGGGGWARLDLTHALTGLLKKSGSFILNG